MKDEKLFQAIGMISDGKIAEADNAPATHTAKPRWSRWAGGAAACLLLALAVYALPMLTKQPELPPMGEADITEDSALQLVPRWDELTSMTRYNTLAWGGADYAACNSEPLSAAAIGAYLGAGQAAGYDFYAELWHRIDCEIYALQGISTACAVAVDYDGTEGYYVFAADTGYVPATLGDLIHDLNLRENLVINNPIYYDRFVEDGAYFVGMKYVLPDPNVIWDLLLADGSVKNVHDDRKWYGQTLGISIDVDIIGAKNISLSVSEEGYLTTNILSTGKTFFIGRDTALAFIDYVLTYGEGTVISDSRDYDYGNDMAPDGNGGDSGYVSSNGAATPSYDRQWPTSDGASDDTPRDARDEPWQSEPSLPPQIDPAQPENHN